MPGGCARSVGRLCFADGGDRDDRGPPGQGQCGVRGQAVPRVRDAFARLAVPKGDPHEDRYNAACCLALGGQRDRSFEQLEAVVNGGFRDVQHLEQDADIGSLHDDCRWRPLLQRVRDNRARHLASRNPELRQLYEQDQGDRKVGTANIDWARLNQRDVAREARVREILASGGARIADDYYHAAMVLQHGEGAADFRLANELALKAVELEPGHRPARWLAAASKDRELMTLGKQQLYGTQFRAGKNGSMERYPVDPSVTNQERARWGVEPVAGAR